MKPAKPARSRAKIEKLTTSLIFYLRTVIGILKLISQGEEDVRIGKSKSQEDVFKRIDTLLKAKLK